MKKILLLSVTVIICASAIEIGLRFTKYGRFANPIYKKDYRQLYRLAPNAKFKFIRVEAHTNSHGVRGKEFPPVKPTDVYRIISFGDSITFGVGLSDEQTYPYRLGELLSDYKTAGNKKIEVINMGIGGYCIVYGLQHLKTSGIKFNPDLVTFAFSGGNESRLDRVNAIRRLRDWDNIFGRSVLVTTMRNAIRRNLKMVDRIVPIKDYERLLIETIDLARKNNKRLLFVVLPWRSQVYPYDSEEDVLSTYEKALEKEKEGRPERTLYYITLEYATIEDIPDKGIRTKNIPPFLREHFKTGIYALKNDNPRIEQLNTEALKLYRLGDYRAAIKKLLESEKISGKYPMTHYYLGVVYGDMGDASKMKEEFEKSVKLSKSCFLQYQTSMRRVAKANNVPVADVMIAFQLAHEPGLFIDKAHHTARGAEVAADEIKKAIIENNLI